MLIIIIFAPLISAFFAGFAGRWIGRNGAALLTSIIMGSNVLLTAALFYQVSFRNYIPYVTIGNWISSNDFQVDWAFFGDNLTIIMLLVVNSISFFVHIYSISYMWEDPHFNRFVSYLSLFTFFMLILVTGENFVLLFLGWEGVGLCSYLLISFWHTRIQANKSAIKALVVNRVADFALTIGIVAIFYTFKSLNFSIVFALAPFFTNQVFLFMNYHVSILSIISIFLFLGAMGKSAQIGLHTWLPDAMEGPTPVSALIHAATMVTAGVFLLIRCSPLFEFVPDVLTFVTFIGATTAFFAASTGLMQQDIKRVIAYSTCSQLGYMIFCCGLSNYNLSLFHLSNHAFFKALLFLSAGAIIHSIQNEQDMRKYGNLLFFLPITSFMLFVGSMALMGFPFLTGFYSKDFILEIALTKFTIIGLYSYLLGLYTAIITAIYSLRVFYITFLTTNNTLNFFKYKKTTNSVSYKKDHTYIHEASFTTYITLIILSFGSIFLGFFSKELFIGLGNSFWNQSIFILPQHNNHLNAEFFGLSSFNDLDINEEWLVNLTEVNSLIKLLPFIYSLLAFVIIIYIFNQNKNSIDIFEKTYITKFSINLSWFLTYKWYFDIIYNEYIVIPLMESSYDYIFNNLDKGIIEWLGPFGISYTFNGVATPLHRIQNGEMYRYAYFILIFLFVNLIFVHYFFY